MTAVEWEAGDDPLLMLGALPPPGDRKLRLFSIAVFRRWHLRELRLQAVPLFSEVLAVAYDLAEGKGEESRLRRTEEALATLASTLRGSETEYAGYVASLQVLRDPLLVGGTPQILRVWQVHWAVRDMATVDERRQEEARHQAALLREVFGNPFRPVAFDPAWRTGTALILARQMYESREFSAAPILADALQDGGCESEELLNHLRSPDATHVRGCWAVDLVLGKT